MYFRFRNDYVQYFTGFTTKLVLFLVLLLHQQIGMQFKLLNILVLLNLLFLIWQVIIRELI